MTPPAICLDSLESGQPREVLSAADGVITIGREPENNLIVSETSVSRRHGCVFSAGSQWVYRDLASTNGSFLNRIKLPPGATRLLRNGDVLQISTSPFQVRFASDQSRQPNRSSLIVFYGDNFQSEMNADDASFRVMVGGESADLVLENSDGSGDRFMISRIGDRLELTITMLGSKVLVNGLVVGGSTALSDRDEISVGPYTLLVNDLTNAVDEHALQAKIAGGVVAREVGVEGPIARPGSIDDEWGSESQRRRAIAQRKFIFGSPTDVGGTLSMGREEFAAHAGLEISSSQRFSQTSLPIERSPTSEVSERVTMIFGFVVFVVIIAAAVFLWLM